MFVLKFKYFFNTIKLFTIFFITLFITKNTIADTNWDGRYNATFQFKMGPGSFVIKLPIEMEIIITNSKAEGFILIMVVVINMSFVNYIIMKLLQEM